MKLLKQLFYWIKKRSTALKRLYRTKKVGLCLLFIIFLLTLFSWFTRDTNQNERMFDLDMQMSIEAAYKYSEDIEEDIQNGLIEDKNKGCALPILDPFDKEAVKLDKATPTGSAVCEEPDLIECYLDECFVSKQYRKKLKHGYCMYRDLLYYGDENIGPRKTLKVHQKYKLVNSDLVEVSCFGSTPLSPGSFQYWSGHKAGLRHIARRNQTTQRRLNIMMIAFKSISRNGFIRKMPKTYKALNEIGAFIFKGYNVVTEQSFGGFFPIFVGQTVLEHFEYNVALDKDKLLFHQLSTMGYRTAHFEDSPFFGPFQHKFKVFRDSLTDHYVLPLLKEVFGDTAEGNRSFCLGGTPLYRTLLNLTHQFLQLNGNRFSFTFISDITNNNFNMGSEADEVLSSFLYNLQQDTKMQETVLFVMSDHGSSSSPFRETIQGKLEERLPLMAIMIPKRLNQMRPDAAAALKANADLLITPFDIHTTLTDILGISDHRNRYKVPGADLERGLSLLRPIPASRSCGEAGVHPLWCACASWHPIPRKDSLYEKIPDMLVKYINMLIEPWSDICQERTLSHVEYVASQLSREKLHEYAEKQKHETGTYSNYYQAKIIVGPGRAVFEGSIRHIMKSDSYVFNEADLTRLDPYAISEESECIRKKIVYLNKFCYCVNYTNTNISDMNKTNKN
ncbi:uncharacterized protein [Choristoneura fumiferana]|uniref:uncharacterized protein n=1 Tax=Choristoneura fumiferana TaxID=7141 RepID=UPI003D15C858